MQVISGEPLRYRALDQWTREIPVVAERGRILDRNGSVLAGNITSYTVFARPNAVEDIQKTAEILSGIFSLDEDDLYEKISSSKVSELTIVRRAGADLTEKLEKYDLPGAVMPGFGLYVGR